MQRFTAYTGKSKNLERFTDEFACCIRPPNLRCGIGTTFVAPPNAPPIVPFCFTLLVSLICKPIFAVELKHLEQRTWLLPTHLPLFLFTLSLALKLGMCPSSACQPSCMHAIWLICTGTTVE